MGGVAAASEAVQSHCAMHARRAAKADARRAWLGASWTRVIGVLRSRLSFKEYATEPSPSRTGARGSGAASAD